MTTVTAEPSARRATIWLFILCNAFFFLTSSGRVRVTDEVMAVFQTESLVHRGSTAVPQAVEARIYYGKYDRKGQPQSANSPAQAVLAIPWYLAGRHLVLRLPGIPAAAHNLVTDFTIVASNATFSAAIVALSFYIWILAGIRLPAALAAAAVVALATPVFCYSAWFFSEPLGGASLLAAIVALLPPDEHGPLSLARRTAGALALGIALWIRPTYLVFVFLVLAALALRKSQNDRWRSVIAVAAIVGLFGLAILARNAELYGNAFDFGYPATAEGGKRLNSFETPFLTGLAAFLLSPGKSIFLFAPPVLAALWAIPRLWRKNRGLGFLAISVPLMSIVLYSKYSQFEGGYSFGPRYMFVAIVTLCLGVGFVTNEGPKPLRALLIVLFALGLTVNLIGLATSPLEDMASGKYYDQNFNYRLDYNPLGGQGSLLIRYLTDDRPAPIGRGWDRWFVFLHKGGVQTGTLLLIAALPAVLLVIAAWKIGALLRHSTVSPTGYSAESGK